MRNVAKEISIDEIAEMKELKEKIEKGKKELDLVIKQGKEYLDIYKKSIELDMIITDYMNIAYKKAKSLWYNIVK